jgi:hypothetical protein
MGKDSEPLDRTVIQKSQVESVVIPAGTFRVLAVIVRHSAKVGDSDLANWERRKPRSITTTPPLRRPAVSQNQLCRLKTQTCSSTAAILPFRGTLRLFVTQPSEEGLRRRRISSLP